MFPSRFANPARNFMTSALRSSHFPQGTPGDNLPFDISNRYKLTAMFILFFGSAFSFPFLHIRFQLLKK